jgi:hypothetical protein
MSEMLSETKRLIPFVIIILIDGHNAKRSRKAQKQVWLLLGFGLRGRRRMARAVMELKLRLERFAVGLFGIARFLPSIADDVDRGSGALVAGCPIFAGIHFAKHILGHR